MNILRGLKNKIIAFILSFCCVLSGCAFGAGYGVYDERVFYAFNGTPVVAKIFGCEFSDEIAGETQNFLNGLNAEFSATENSTVYAINTAAAGEKTAVSDRFSEIYADCIYMNEFTQGKFDVSVYPLTLIWQFAPNFPVADFLPPDAAAISAAQKLVGKDKFALKGGELIKTETGAKLDLGGALKGYAADKIADHLKSKGASGGYINCGNSSLYIISADTLSVVHPRNDGNILKITETLTDVAVATSGDYERTYFHNGETYSHIIDPESGLPAKTHIASATVVTKNGLKADALSTALCLFSHDPVNPENGELVRFIKSALTTSDFKDAAFYVVYDDGDYKQIITNKKQGENFTLLGSDYSVYFIG